MAIVAFGHPSRMCRSPHAIYDWLVESFDGPRKDAAEVEAESKVCASTDKRSNGSFSRKGTPPIVFKHMNKTSQTVL